jgi:hypothetical protein
MTKFLWSLMMLFLMSTLAAPAEAQDRTFPAANGSTFVEQSDPGGICRCQVLVLNDAYAPPTHLNVYGPAVPVRVKPTADILIYNADSEWHLLVKSTPFGYTSPYAAMGVWEQFEWVRLSPNMVWTAGDLDGDGRTDLTGINQRTGAFVRAVRR